MAEITEVSIDRMATGGEGVGRDAEGRVVFASGALPGERAEVEITEAKKRFARGAAVEIEEPSRHRIEPPCPFVAGGCGGCDWQHVDPAAQPEFKASVVRDALERIGRVTAPVVSAGEPLAPDAYRTTLRMGVTSDGQVAFRARRGHELVSVGPCMIAHPLLDELVQQVRFPGAREVTLRCGARTGERLVLLDGPPKKVRGLPADVVLISALQLKRGATAAYHEDVAGRRWRISARSFFQARPDGAEALVRQVRDAAGDELDGARMVDAYCGVGLFAGTLVGPGQAAAVIGIESGRGAVRDARHNLPGVHIDHADVATWPTVEADLVVADPARQGLGALAAGRLAATGAPVIVLVSCDAGSLGRDAGLLGELGYRHDGSTLVDMFPRTSHTEVVTRFVRKS